MPKLGWTRSVLTSESIRFPCLSLPAQGGKSFSLCWVSWYTFSSYSSILAACSSDSEMIFTNSGEGNSQDAFHHQEVKSELKRRAAFMICVTSKHKGKFWCYGETWGRSHFITEKHKKFIVIVFSFYFHLAKHFSLAEIFYLLQKNLSLGGKETM